MKTDRFWAALCVLMFMVFLLVSASKAETYRIVEKQGDKELKIGFSFDTFVLERWTRDRDVFVSTARKLGASVDIKNANGDISKQSSIMHSSFSFFHQICTIIFLPSKFNFIVSMQFFLPANSDCFHQINNTLY